MCRFTNTPVVYCPPRFSTGFSIVSDSQGATDFVFSLSLSLSPTVEKRVREKLSIGENGAKEKV